MPIEYSRYDFSPQSFIFAAFMAGETLLAMLTCSESTLIRAGTLINLISPQSILMTSHQYSSVSV